MTITEYIQEQRMNLAEHLLTTTQLEIKEVANAVGYKSHSRFSSLFKKYIGVYPHELKSKQLFFQQDSLVTLVVIRLVNYKITANS